MAAFDAFPTSPDGCALFRHPRVDHPVVVGQTPRAPHSTRLVPGPALTAFGEQPSADPTHSPDGQGTTIRWPGTTWSEPSCAVSLATKGRGSAVGSTRSAMDQRVSPGRTV